MPLQNLIYSSETLRVLKEEKEKKVLYAVSPCRSREDRCRELRRLPEVSSLRALEVSFSFGELVSFLFQTDLAAQQSFIQFQNFRSDLTIGERGLWHSAHD